MKSQGTVDKVRRLLAHVWPLEILVLLQLVLTVGFLRAHHLRVDWTGFWYIVRPLFRGLPFYLLIGVLSMIVLRLVADRSLQPALERLRKPSYYVVWLRLWTVVLLGSYCYGWLKVNVPLVNRRLWDEPLWDLDVLLHLGLSPSVFLVSLFEGSFLNAWVDGWYGFWAQTVMVTLIVLSAFHRDDRRRVFVGALVLLWIFGAWLYVALPALGPIYAFPDVFRDGVLAYPRATGTQLMLWQNYQVMLQGLATGQLTAFNPTRGIAAMPSLHVGTHVLFALWAWRRFRPLFVVFLLAAIFTYLGSIATGWHYAVDGWVGAGLAWFSLYLAERFSSWKRPEKDAGQDGESEGAAEAEAAAV